MLVQLLIFPEPLLRRFVTLNLSGVKNGQQNCIYKITLIWYSEKCKLKNAIENNVYYLSDAVITQECKCSENTSSITTVLEQQKKKKTVPSSVIKKTCNPRNFASKIISPCCAMQIHSKSLRNQHTNNSGT